MATSEPEFEALMDRLRHGKEDAAWQLVEIYGPHVMAVLRRKLNRQVRVRVDSDDLAQSVWKSFFVCIPTIRNMQTHGQLIALLVGMAEHKLADAYRHEVFAAGRGIAYERRKTVGDMQRQQCSTPSQFAIARERWEAMLQSCSPIQQEIVRLRLMGETFEAIGALLGISERTARRVIDDLIAEEV